MFRRKKASGDTTSSKDNGSGSSSTGSASSSRLSGREKPKKTLSKTDSTAHMNSKVKSTSTGGLRSSSKEVSSLSKNMDRLSMREDDVKSSTSHHSIQSTTASTTSGSSKDKKKSKHSISYAAERVIGNGSFGVVYQATVIESGETVAIKKVLQDRRFKNRELQIMRMLDHPSVVALKHSFLAKGDKASQPDDVYLNLVMEYIPETIHRQVRNHFKAKKSVPLMYIKVYMYQMCRALAYIHSQGICHRDIKPQNLLLDPQTHVVKLCDFGSAKVLTKGQPNVAYICSRYYRAPELVFEATEYTTAIDIWSLGCVMAELLLCKPLFAGESTVDQLIEIIKILGTPSREEIFAMNPNHTTFNFPQITAHPWSKVFRYKAPNDAVDLVSKFLQYKPQDRLDPFEALIHPFFNELRKPDAKLPNGKPPPSVFNWTKDELIRMQKLGMTDKLNPPHIRKTLVLPPVDEAKVEPVPAP